VVWHQTLLVFVQRYRNEITTEQRVHLKALLRKQVHPSITVEIRRELFAQAALDVSGSAPKSRRGSVNSMDTN
jgi:essential nuclear protein 1